MKLTEINNNKFELDDDNNDVVLNSLNIGLKSYFSSYKSIRENFDERTYECCHKQDYYENFSETILHFHHFFELILKDLLRYENELLPLVISGNSDLVIKLIQNIPLSDDEYKKFKSLSFSQLLDRVCKLIKLKSEVKFKFIKEYKDELNELNDLRNKIWHQGKVMLKYEAFDFLIGKYILPLVISGNSDLVIKLIQNIPLSDDEYKKFKSLSFSQLLDRVCKLIKLKSEVKFKFIKEYKDELNELNDLRNKIWHQGKVMLKYEAFDFLIGKYILPLVIKCLEVSEYRGKYRSHEIWRFNRNSLEINPLEDLLEEFQNESPAIDKIAVLKELGRASYYSHYGKGFGSIMDSRNQSANQLAQAELNNSFTFTNEILKCPCCAAMSLVTYTKEVITDIHEYQYEDEQGNVQFYEQEDSFQCIYTVKCANCSFQLNDKGIKNLKEYEFDVEDYWINIDHY
ncbi:hypothetical protein [Staphylococcus equorum]|uniref:hypothetical protein n=1 Tax=Staphylococcus equorum TaxID=246432 RepID=UPI0039AFD7C4